MDCANGFWCFQLKDLISLLILVATIIAIYRGPIRAVEITRENDEKREHRRRQYEIFHSLMKTRRIALAPEHVMALNVIVIEFYGLPKINDAFKRYVEHLNQSPRDGNYGGAFFREREDRFFELVHEIGAHLEFSLDKRDLDKFSYVPQGWNDIESEQAQLRRLAVQLLSGKLALPITKFRPGAFGKFPEPPKFSGVPDSGQP